MFIYMMVYIYESIQQQKIAVLVRSTCVWNNLHTVRLINIEILESQITAMSLGGRNRKGLTE